MIPRFRVYDEKLGVIKPVSYIDFTGKEVMYYLDDEDSLDIIRSFDEVNIMESTRLNDIHGKEIFTEDIIILSGAPKKEYLVGRCYHIFNAHRIDIGGAIDLLEHIEEIEVIDNWFDREYRRKKELDQKYIRHAWRCD